MPKFGADTITADTLDWDFSGFGVARLEGVKGVVPEPSDKQIGEFLDRLKEVYAAAREKLPNLPEDASAEEMLEAVSSVTGKDWVDLMADIAGLFAHLCSNQPTKAQLLLLPMRYRVHFFAWVQGEVVNPEVGTGAGTAAVSQLRPAAAG